MAQYMTFRFDVTALTKRQREALASSVIQHQGRLRDLVLLACRPHAQIGDYNHEAAQKWADEHYPDVPVCEVCHFCGQVVENGECGGEGEGRCIESMCVTDFSELGRCYLADSNDDAASTDDVEVYVRDYCAEYGIVDSLVPYRADGLTYYQQLAYMVREYHNLPHPKR